MKKNSDYEKRGLKNKNVGVFFCNCTALHMRSNLELKYKTRL